MAATYDNATRSRPAAMKRRSSLAARGRLITRLPRFVRFAGVGGGCAILQLLVLAFLVRRGVEPHGANAIAFLLSTQVNFALSSAITWRDRLAAPWRGAILRRLAGYNALALCSLAVNGAVFALALPAAPYLVAAGLGIVAGTGLTYTVSGRVLFRPPASRSRRTS
jgi:putative flippase GtrA